MGHKAVINSRLYDTKTALYIGGKANYWHTSNRSSLFLKKTGEYFIYNVLDGCLPDSMKEALYPRQKNSIIPLTEEEAKALVEEWCSADEYIRLFGDVDE